MACGIHVRPGRMNPDSSFYPACSPVCSFNFMVALHPLPSLYAGKRTLSDIKF